MALLPECGPMLWRDSIVVFPFIADSRWFLRPRHKNTGKSTSELVPFRQQGKADQSNNQKESPDLSN